tara:strand:- start:159 stop:365 length:207 start_codon:yes stop_codon:yes gene_type:complete
MDTQLLALYIATYITEEYEEAEQEDIEPLSEVISQALEAYEGGAREATYKDEYNQALVEMGYTLKEII